MSGPSLPATISVALLSLVFFIVLAGISLVVFHRVRRHRAHYSTKPPTDPTASIAIIGPGMRSNTIIQRIQERQERNASTERLGSTSAAGPDAPVVGPADTSRISAQDPRQSTTLDPRLSFDAETLVKINELGPLAWHLIYPKTDRRGMGSVTIRDGRYVDWYKVGRAVQTNLPIPVTLHPKNLWYFEVTVLLATPSSRINIGLAPYNPLPRPLGAGWEENEVGFISTGRKVVNGTSVVGEKYGRNFGQGNTIGCGFNRNGTVFFVVDNVQYPPATTTLSPLLAYFPVLSGSSSTSLKLNLGQEPFLYPPANSENWGFMVDALPGYGDNIGNEEVKHVSIEVREGVPRMSVLTEGPPEYGAELEDWDAIEVEGDGDGDPNARAEAEMKEGSEDAIDDHAHLHPHPHSPIDLDTSVESSIPEDIESTYVLSSNRRPSEAPSVSSTAMPSLSRTAHTYSSVSSSVAAPPPAALPPHTTDARTLTRLQTSPASRPASPARTRPSPTSSRRSPRTARVRISTSQSHLSDLTPSQTSPVDAAGSWSRTPRVTSGLRHEGLAGLDERNPWYEG